MPKAAITRVPGLEISTSSTKNNGLYIPQLTTAQRDAIPANLLRAGAMIYNTTTSTYQGYNKGASSPLGAWGNLTLGVSTATPASGVGLAAGNSPFVLPSGASGDVQVAANQINGFMYYNTALNDVRIWINNAWRIVTTTGA